jgi:hypothetical protein
MLSTQLPIYKVTYNMLGRVGLTFKINAYYPAHAVTLLKKKLPYAEVVGTPELVSC